VQTVIVVLPSSVSRQGLGHYTVYVASRKYLEFDRNMPNDPTALQYEHSMQCKRQKCRL
jgi:hypothetical protein